MSDANIDFIEAGRDQVFLRINDGKCDISYNFSDEALKQLIARGARIVKRRMQNETLVAQQILDDIGSAE